MIVLSACCQVHIFMWRHTYRGN